MESLISHLITNPKWVPVSAFISLILFGLLTVFTFIQADNDDKNENKKNKKLSIKYIFYFIGILFFMIAPIMLLLHKYNQYNKIVQNKEYILTKKGKILNITSTNEFLPSTNLEIIYDDNKTIQVKLDEKLYIIDKASEKIDGD